MIDKQEKKHIKKKQLKRQDFTLLILNLYIMCMYKKDAFNAKKKGTTTYKIWEHKGQSTVLMKQFSWSLESSQDI